MPVIIRAYTSPTVVVLGLNWPEGGERTDFLGFAIQRTPGFYGDASSWLPNRIGFDGPKADQSDIPCNQAPIQKCQWFDARIRTQDRGTTISYRVTPVVGTPSDLQLLDGEAATERVRIPQVEENGITTHFNRAVMSSQSFQKQFPRLDTAEQQKSAEAWLANGMETAIPDFLERAAGKGIEGAIYHLTDHTWIIPAMIDYAGPISLAYNQTRSDHASDAAIQELVANGRADSSFVARTKANIMHNKFLVRVDASNRAEAVLMGSANFTSEGLSAQANVLHIFESAELAQLYLDRKRILDKNPALAATQRLQSGWSDPIIVGDATTSMYFPPAGANDDTAVEEIVEAINNSQHSVLICAFDPTYVKMLDAAKQKAVEGKMVLGLVNRISEQEPTGDPNRADVGAAIELWKWSEEDHAVVGFGAFKTGHTPTDFMPERVLWPHEDIKIMVRVHHKFVVIDAEGENPIVFTGSANFSGNSLHKNDENQMKITNCPRLAGIYMAEFLRLYEHYRARFAFERRQNGEDTFKLTADNSWSKKYYTPGTPEYKSRVAMTTKM